MKSHTPSVLRLEESLRTSSPHPRGRRRKRMNDFIFIQENTSLCLQENKKTGLKHIFPIQKRWRFFRMTRRRKVFLKK